MNQTARNSVVNQVVWPQCVETHGERNWGAWEEPDPSHFNVRDSHYLSTGHKKKSNLLIFQLAQVQLLSCTPKESEHIAVHQDSWYSQHCDSLPQNTFHLIINYQISSINVCVVSYYVLADQPRQSVIRLYKQLSDRLINISHDEEHGPLYSDHDIHSNIDPKTPTEDDTKIQNEELSTFLTELASSPRAASIRHKKNLLELMTLPCHDTILDESGLWERFCEGDDNFINTRLKMIPRIHRGPWYFKIPSKPVLIGTKVPQRAYRGYNYLEIDCTPDLIPIAAAIVRSAKGISSKLAIDLVFLIQGAQENELPESLLAGVRLIKIDCSKAIPLVDN